MNKNYNRALVERKIMRPGKGWRKTDGAVFERLDGLRVHMLGLVRLPDGRKVSGSVWPESLKLHRFICINGGNRKRGVMAWANDVAARGA